MKSPLFFSLSALALAALALAASLTACGGGGGETAAPAANPSAVALQNNDIVTAIAPANYAPGSEEEAAFNRLNNERSQCGFGLLTQAVQLDAAAKSHNDYQIINNTVSHLEDQAQFPNGFTGTHPKDRAIAKGYIDSGSVMDEFVMRTSWIDKQSQGDKDIRLLLSAPYHLAGLMNGNKDVGISVRSSNETTPAGENPAVLLHLDSSYKTAAGKQLISTGDVLSYPCDGSTDVISTLSNEVPNPIPGRDLSFNPIGTPIYIATREGTQLIIATASMIETETNTPVVLRTPITSSNDPQSFYKMNQSYFAPDTPLKSFTNYTATVTGSANGTAFRRIFSFATGL